jgi:hypothetical protein
MTPSLMALGLLSDDSRIFGLSSIVVMLFVWVNTPPSYLRSKRQSECYRCILLRAAFRIPLSENARSSQPTFPKYLFAAGFIITCMHAMKD